MEMICKILCDFDFMINNKSLSHLYRPIIGKDGVELYNTLVSEYDLMKNLYHGISLNMDQILLKLNIKYDEFTIIRNKLEAVGLLSTYFDENKKNLFVFKLYEPLSWKEFSKKEKYMNILKLSTSDLEFERLKFAFEGNDKTIGLTNISATFENVFKNLNEKEFNFNSLCDDLFKLTNNLISIPDNSCNKINQLYKSNKLSYNEILMACYKSIYKDGKKLLIDEKILTLKVESSNQIKRIDNFNHVIKNNRNLKIFTNNIKENELKNIINDYHLINSEQYLSCLQEKSITDLEVGLIENLRNVYYLPDFIINILLDFSIFVNNGRLEPLYIQKIVVTLKRKNITNAIEVINHLKSAIKHRENNNCLELNKGINW